MTDSQRKITIVGTGIVGSAWAVVFARGKFAVCLYDTDAQRTETALADSKKKLEALSAANLLQEPVDTILNRISTATDLQTALNGAFYVQECIPELIELKKDLWQKLDTLADPSIILASSTSGIPASRFVEGLTHVKRCLVAHPINPPHLIFLVEIVPTPWTSPEITQATRDLMTQVGQKPVVLQKEVSGFAINRLQYALLGECLRMVQDGVLSPEDVDTALQYGLAPRWSFMGPFQTIDLNAPQGIQDYCARYLPGLLNVLKEQDNSLEITNDTVQKLSDFQRGKYPAEEIPNVTQWRDARLMALQSHHQKCKEIDSQFGVKL